MSARTRSRCAPSAAPCVSTCLTPRQSVNRVRVCPSRARSHRRRSASNRSIRRRITPGCDRPGCRGLLEPKNFDEITRLRHLAYPKYSGGGCGHHDRKPEETPATDRGMSERHRWMQNRITAICRQLKYSTVPEHQLTQADVYVETTRTALEVQQRATDFARRTAARTKNGAAQTIWLLSHDANQPAVRRALFELPAVRFKVVDRRLPREHRTVEFEPWRDIETLDEHAAVDVWATTWQLVETQPYLQTCKLDLHLFLNQIHRRNAAAARPA